MSATSLLLSCGFFVVGCSFAPSSNPIDAAKPDAVDAAIDAPAGPAASCNVLHARNPSLPSGTYAIDPDGAGGDAELAVTCDMSVAGGGWTLVYFQPTPNVLARPQAYTTATQRLLDDAQTVLLVYRNATQVAALNFATFDLPLLWRADVPFNYPAVDLNVNVSVNSAAPVVAMLRYGYQGFGNNCGDSWDPNSMLGRICIVGTKAPFYDGFSDPLQDNCGDSLGSWNGAPCMNDSRFSIAVR